MSVVPAAAIDCDIHPAAPPMRALVPYLSAFWREQIVSRYIDRMAFTLTSHPPGLPINARADWRAQSGGAAESLDAIRAQLLDPFGLRFAICNVLHGAMAMHNGDMAAAIIGALNDWIAHELLDPEPRLRASIVLPMQEPANAVAEIEKRAGDRRFVQAMALAANDMPLGRRAYWPVYAALEKAGLPLCVHAGSAGRNGPMGTGWPSYYTEDLVAQSALFEGVTLSLLAEGVFDRFPDLTVVLAESGATWLPQFMWRQDKMWRAARPETPWVDRFPRLIIGERVRLTLQPFDAPSDPATVARLIEHMGNDDFLLFSTDYPHHRFQGRAAMPEGFTPALARRIAIDNPMKTYARLADLSHAPQIEEASS